VGGPGAGIVPPGPGMPIPKAKGGDTSSSALRLPPRTEFIIIFIWQEPMTAESPGGPANPNENKQ
jgi:hypothetical protein